jgi:hypothetical protein
MYPSNSFMDGSAIGSFLPILKVPIIALRAVSQRRKFQPLVPTVPEECAPPVCALLLARILLQVSPARFFFGPAPLLTVYFGAPSMFITLWFGFYYGTNPPLGTLII